MRLLNSSCFDRLIVLRTSDDFPEQPIVLFVLDVEYERSVSGFVLGTDILVVQLEQLLLDVDDQGLELLLGDLQILGLAHAGLESVLDAFAGVLADRGGILNLYGSSNKQMKKVPCVKRNQKSTLCTPLF